MTLTSPQQQRSPDRDRSWPYWPALPIYPYGKRRTIRRAVLKDTIWTFEQLQGIFYVIVSVRMTVVKLDAGGLLVYAPVAPTSECIQLVNELVAEHGEVKYIILPTISGLEHKVFVGPFARRFPDAQVFVAPHQWSFPVDLPLSWLGFPRHRTHVLPDNSNDAPFAQEFDYARLGPIYLGPGQFEEVALFHRRSRTLLVTDAVVSVPEHPPALLQSEPFPLLFHARNSAAKVTDTYTNRRRGWQRIVLFALYFRPHKLTVPGWGQVLRDALQSSDRSTKNYFGLFPFRWADNWQWSFEALQGNGGLFVAPVLQTLILNRAPQETLEWAERVANWNFQRIIPCHFDAPVAATPQQFRRAFSFLEKYPAIGSRSNCYPLPEEDFQLLQDINRRLTQSGIVPPSKEQVAARRDKGKVAPQRERGKGKRGKE
ncbi:MAG: DUF4336 domain-containing protein [Cyanophyceae cyanobacterium]